jgi:hypothetical protein
VPNARDHTSVLFMLTIVIALEGFSFDQEQEHEYE